MKASVLRAQAKDARLLLLTGFLLLACLVALGLWFAHRQRDDAAQARQIAELQTELTGLLFIVQEAESGQRGYLVTGDSSYLAPYEKARQSLPEQMAQLRGEVGDGLTPAEFAGIQSILRDKMNELAHTVTLYRDHDPAAALALVKTNEGRDTMVRLHALVGQILDEQGRRAGAMKAREQREGLLLELAAFLAMLATLGLAWFAIRESHARTLQMVGLHSELNRIFTLSTDILAVFDAAGRFKSVSPAWTQATGTPIAGVLGRTLREFVHPEDLPATDAAFAQVQPGGPIMHHDNRIRRADGTYCWVSWRAVPLPESGAIYSIGRDVTEERAREEQLRQSQKMEIVGQLTGGIAHDFNNLLTIILGSLELLQRGLKNADERMQRRVDAAMDGAKRAAALTHRLLAFARRQPLDPQAIDPNKLVAGMSEILHRVLGEQVALEFVAGAGLWRIMADGHQLENAILNLAVNARDAMPGGGHLTIETQNVALDDAYAAAEADVLPGQYVLIAVTDTGIGMAPDIVSKVFEPFFTTKPVGHGTGLGLAQVYGFIKQSEGHIKIYSELGQGSTVKLYLPRYRGASAGEPRPNPPNAADLRGQGEIVLVVEDEENVRNFAVEVLQDYGYAAIGVDNAAAALPLIETEPKIDLLFTDVVLTGPVNGRQLADLFLQKRPGAPVLFTTGYTRNAIIHHGRLDEGLEFIGKPFTATALAQKIRRVLENRVG